MVLKLGLQHQGLKLYTVYMSNDPVYLDLFYGKVKCGLGKTVTKSFNEENLQQRTKSTK